MFLDFCFINTSVTVGERVKPRFSQQFFVFSSFLLRGNQSKPALVNKKAHSVLKNKDEMGFPWYHLV